MVLAQLTLKNSVVLTGKSQRVEVESSHDKYNDVLDAMRGNDSAQLEVLMNEIIELKKHPPLNYSMTNNSITLSSEGAETVIIGRFDIRFNKIKQAIENKQWGQVRENMNPAKALEGSEFELKEDGFIYHKEDKLPQVISKRLQDLIIRGMPFDSVLNFWKKLKKNPSYNTRQQLFSFLEANNVPLREDGDFVAYKKVRDDFKDIHSGKMDNSVGTVVKMDRAQVDDNPNNTCSSGLHVCSFDYLSHFGASEGNRVVLCSISPENVVSVPVDYNNAKMRCCEYKVIEEMEFVQAMNRPVFESKTTFNDHYDVSSTNTNFFDDNGYTEELRDEVVSLYNEYSGRYSGEFLVERILEALENDFYNEADETIDNDVVDQILNDEGYNDY
jgi:hypothetical protein